MFNNSKRRRHRNSQRQKHQKYSQYLNEILVILETWLTECDFPLSTTIQTYTIHKRNWNNYSSRNIICRTSITE